MRDPYDLETEPMSEVHGRRSDEFELDETEFEPEWEEERAGRARIVAARRARPPATRPSRRVALRRPPRRLPRVGSGAERPICVCPAHGTEFVRWVQSALNGIFGLRLPVDGVMNVSTRSALRRFQQQRGLPANGIAGPDTEQALLKARTEQASRGATSQDSAEPDDAAQAQELDFDIEETEWQGEVSRSSSEYIKWTQRSLNQILGLRLDEDGIIGSMTRSAIRAFQQRSGLAPDGIVGAQTEAALVAAGASRPPLAAPVTPAPSPYPPTSGGALRNRAASIAVEEWTRWGKGTIKESNPNIRPVLEDYWRSATGSVPSSSNWWSNVAWSAVFISWVMRKAGAGSNFRYSSAHTEYVGAAKRNKLTSSSNPFKAYRLAEFAPRVGDIVCVERSSSGVTYDNVDDDQFRASHCDIVVEVQPGKLITIGGNLSDSVGRKEVAINASGIVSARGYYAVLAVGAPAGAAAGAGVGIAAPPGAAGITNVRGIEVAGQIAAQVEALLKAAHAQGIKLGGSGFRSPDRQIALRKQNCGPSHYDIYEKPSEQCSPPTARPGSSNHERGLAIDFTYQGSAINSQSNPGFRWLAQNAAKFGLKNFAKEPWHWSVDGR
jgi:peptidoglycan hydrolase-like protein with peptidoglycan-binding domain